MGLADKLRSVEEQGRGAVHRGLEEAREAWDDAERRLRRQMRLHPRCEPEGVQRPVSSSQEKEESADHILPNQTNKERNAA